MIQGNTPEDIQEFAASPEGQKFLGWGWDGQEVVEIDGQYFPAMDGVRMYDSPTGFLDNLLSGSGISNLFSGQPEARNTEAVSRGVRIAPIAAPRTTDNTNTIEEDIDKQSSEVAPAPIAAPTSVDAPVPYGSQPGGNYEIQPGDTLWNIALDFVGDQGAFPQRQEMGNIVERIKEMNPDIEDFDRIAAGGTLNVPVNDQDNFDAEQDIDRTLPWRDGNPVMIRSAPLQHDDNFYTRDGKLLYPPPLPPQTAESTVNQKTYNMPPPAAENAQQKPMARWQRQSGKVLNAIQNVLTNRGNLPNVSSKVNRPPTYVAPNQSLAQRQNEIANTE
jgi:hypothetical protein